MIDGAAIGLAVGLMGGRIGCYAVGEHLGGTTSFPLGITYRGTPGDTIEGPLTVGETYWALPVLEFLYVGVILAIMLVVDRSGRRGAGTLAGIFCVGYAVCRFASDFLREYDPTVYGFTGAQYMTMVLLPVGVFFLLTATRRESPATTAPGCRPRRPRRRPADPPRTSPSRARRRRGRRGRPRRGDRAPRRPSTPSAAEPPGPEERRGAGARCASPARPAPSSSACSTSRTGPPGPGRCSPTASRAARTPWPRPGSRRASPPAGSACSATTSPGSATPAGSFADARSAPTSTTSCSPPTTCARWAGRRRCWSGTPSAGRPWWPRPPASPRSRRS